MADPEIQKPIHGPYFTPEGSPHLHIVESINGLLQGYIKKHTSSKMTHEPKFLDVGGAGGRDHTRDSAREAEDYLLDIDPAASGPEVMIGDICDYPKIVDSSFDIIFSDNVFEHIAEPWKAAREIGRILRPGRICLTKNVFSWRYHPVPEDPRMAPVKCGNPQPKARFRINLHAWIFRAPR